MYYVVYDNFLRPHEFGNLKQYMETTFPWRLSARINNNDTSNEDRYFATPAFHAYSGGWLDIVNPDPFTVITSKLYVEGLHRIKGNLYFPSRTDKVSHHAKHRDGDFKHQGALFFINTCDAPTTMEDGTEIEAIENRLLLFDPISEHSSSSPTNAPYRITINFNYFGAGIRDFYKPEMLNPHPTIAKNEHMINDIFINKETDKGKL
jgi:hypothetical protein